MAMSTALPGADAPDAPDEPTASAAGRGPAVRRGTTVLVALAAATVTAIGISALRGILAPTLLTLVLVICANPVRTLLLKKGVPGGIATGSVILVVFGFLAGFTYTILIAFAQFVAMLPSYSAEFAAIGEQIAAWLSDLGVAPAEIQSVLASLNPASIAAAVRGALGSVLGITGALVIILTMMILMAADAVYSRTILGQLGTHEPHLVVAVGRYASNVRHYMVVTAALGLVQGALNAVALYLMQVPAALLWGLLAFLCSFIPNIGYFFAIIPPLVFGFLVGGWPTAIAIIVIYGLVNAVIQSVIQPRLVGQAVSLSQTLTFFSVLFWAAIIGPIGAILAIPLTLLAKTVLVDADPAARWWQPALGPTDVTRALARTAAAEAKRERRHRRVAHAKPPTSPDLPTDDVKAD
ncbi:AI-2E family transporter [Cryobacterium adonitolivorans]|uniref:AI-2E family transporter n=1 Tax=Cryobacterium adonitolivorans TaxID=1259189 RepID=A0A4R8WG58_9MICO|nr:AI-2E family transporter [Cryobacterium adonitolivorans]TFC06902.1 AI-2E family transporter [Cryobacterium adonitolivorans]